MTLYEIEQQLAAERAKTHPSEPVILCLEILQRNAKLKVERKVGVAPELGMPYTNNTPFHKEEDIYKEVADKVYTEQGEQAPWWVNT